MINKRQLNAGIPVEKSKQEAMLMRNKNTIVALSDLMKDSAFVKHRKTLDEVAKAVNRAIESDHKWSTKCHKLQTELVEKESKLMSSIELSERDKRVIETLKRELEETKNAIEELKQQDNSHSGRQNFDDELERMRNFSETESKCNETLKKGDTDKDSYNLIEEIERGKLLIFELEEELTNKEKHVEELITALNSKSTLFEDTKKENEKLKMALEESMSSSKTIGCKNQSCQTIGFDTDSKSNKIISSLKKKLQDINKKDQLSLENVKYLIKNNKAISRQLQIVKNQNSLLKLELAEQTKILDLLSCQCCKLEEKDKKQNVTISELQRIRDKYVHMIGNLEQEIHDMKKRSNL